MAKRKNGQGKWHHDAGHMARMRESLAKKRIAQRARRCQLFLEHMEKWGIPSAAARFASTALRSFYEWKDADPDFAKAWGEAFEKSTELLEAEALRRARRGV